MAKQFIRNYDTSKITHFVAVGQTLDKLFDGGTLNFSEYVDRAGVLGKQGRLVRYTVAKDERGKEKGKYFNFNENLRRLSVRDSDIDLNDVSMYDFLKNYPTCEGSPNGDYVLVNGEETQMGVEFREMDSDKDADTALAAESKRTEAKASALKLDEATLQEVAAFIGYFGQTGQRMRLNVVEFADKRPSDYFKVLNAGDRNVRAIIRKAKADGLFNEKGSLIYWEGTLIGADEDAAVATLLNDEKMLDVLQTKVDLGTEAKATTQKRKPGRPKKDAVDNTTV